MAEPHLDDLRAEAEQATRTYQELRRNFAVLQQELAAVRGQATSPDGFVRAETGAHGELLDLRLDGRIYRNPDATALARTITETVASAAQIGAERTRAVNERYATGGMTAAGMNNRLENLDAIQERLMERWPE
ncbi:YbaB/EbfC family nucleoid-associated protein [Kineosporia babensis]|uniref:YbaB/EbfC family nucleoid-associated protein n=1 Tax=Kineosporia babensis TaxID=499548 RepID=A0A9X1N7Q4_9ACTN|nr:YbaB/EbfC family nucleoid-associated protein [Kineosporia babensis]MCD5309992.1 YbaB/EbfC family nucleoid-associated protein [Kineosporia babensis]